MNATHFIATYSVPCKNLGTGIIRIDHCSSGLRDIKYIIPYMKSVGDELVAVFKIKIK